MNYTYTGSELDVFSLASNWKAYYKKLIEEYLGDEVLEIGAGIGATTEALCDPGKKKWVCLEPDPAQAARIKQRNLPPCCEVREGTLSSLDARESFDSILYIDVLEHIEDDRREVEMAARHLKGGGHLVILAPAHQLLYTPFDKQVGHYRRYSKSLLTEVVPKTLRERRLYYVDSVGALASLGNKLALRSPMPTRRQLMFWDRVLIPLSRIVDPLIRHTAGKTIIGVWQK